MTDKSGVSVLSMSPTESQYRRMFLDFYCTEINTHSRLFIGLSVTLFTLLELLRLTYRVTEAEVLIYAPIGVVSTALLYLLFRHLTYGALANACIWAELSEKEFVTLREVNMSIVGYASRTSALFRIRGRGLIPVRYFTSEKHWGALLSIGFGIIATLTLFWLNTQIIR